LAASLAATLVLTLLLSGSALAVTTYTTSLTIKASSTSIHKGQKVVFKGKLKSSFAKCRKFSDVTLYRKGVAVATKTTNKKGAYKFVQHPKKTGTYQVKFAGKTGGVHPSQWACKASKSKKIQVRVRH
jgi:hypothetical protein